MTKYLHRVTADAQGWIPGMKVWDVRGYDSKNTLIARVHEDMGNNHVKMNAFVDACKKAGYALTEQQWKHLSGELSLQIPYAWADNTVFKKSVVGQAIDTVEKRVHSAVSGSNMITGDAADYTTFSQRNKDILALAEAYDKVYVNVRLHCGMPENTFPPVNVTWSQGHQDVTKKFFAEIYVRHDRLTNPFNIGAAQPKHLAVLFVDAECGSSPYYLRTDGASMGNGVLHFGATIARDQVFFAILPTNYTCFQRRFLDCMPGTFFTDATASMNNFIANQVIHKGAGKAMTYATTELISDMSAAAGTAVCPIVGTIVGKGLGYAAGWVATQGATGASNMLGDRLRFIGPSNEKQLAQYLPLENISVTCHEHKLKRMDLDHPTHAWSCNGRKMAGGCRQNITGPPGCLGTSCYSCVPCRFDLCASCVDKHIKSSTAPAKAAAAPSGSGFYLLVSERYPSVCLDVKFGDVKAGAVVWTYGINRTRAQQWRLTAEGYLESALNGMVLDIEGSSKADGAKVLMWTKHGGPNQKWRYENGMLLSQLHGKALDLHGDSKGPETPLHVWGSHGGPNQKWKFVAV